MSPALQPKTSMYKLTLMNYWWIVTITMFLLWWRLDHKLPKMIVTPHSLVKNRLDSDSKHQISNHCIFFPARGIPISKVVSTHPDIAHPRQSPVRQLWKKSLFSLLVKVAVVRGVFQFGVLKQPLTISIRPYFMWIYASFQPNLHDLNFTDWLTHLKSLGILRLIFLLKMCLTHFGGTKCWLNKGAIFIDMKHI